jgi:hypothetical protein
LHHRLDEPLHAQGVPEKAIAAGDVSRNGGGLEAASKQLDSIGTTGCCPIGLW